MDIPGCIFARGTVLNPLKFVLEQERGQRVELSCITASTHFERGKNQFRVY